MSHMRRLRLLRLCLSLVLLALNTSEIICWILNARHAIQNERSTITSPTQLHGIREPKERKAYPQQTPHSGRHFVPSHPAYQSLRRRYTKLLRRRGTSRHRFMEGWYYRLTLPEANFVFVISIEDPGNNKSEFRLSCIQIIGPNDGYLVQADKDDTKFWAWKYQQGLGCAFELKQQPNVFDDDKPVTARTKEEFHDQVESGFQILPNHLMGRIRGHDGSLGGVLAGQGHSGSCDFDISVEPLCGWGDVQGDQKSTAGWLSNFAVFEPHWQVTLADARATGTVTWNNHTYKFAHAPLYAEKNWGAALPPKWYWTQCNSFSGYEQLSVTAGGGVRTIPFGRRESLGMVSIHHNGIFYEGTPWTGNMEWKVTPFGSWELKGYGIGQHPFEAVVKYECDPETTPGLVFRAPTPDQGMVLFCRATFKAQCILTLWELEWNSSRKIYVRKAGPPLIDRATSLYGGAEVGGGPWWDEWGGESKLKQPIRGLLQLPVRLANLRRRYRKSI
ncbi:hypothetical protein MPSEU_000892800 [Mayamaea pseudoterrestris]|nr:hypothetical protein MPSEU_000892800 [Mayamaea pseudoterrestris]